MMIMQRQLIIHFLRLRLGRSVCKVLGHFIGSLHEDSGQSGGHLVSVSVADEGKVDQLIGEDLGSVASAEGTRNLRKRK